MVCEKCGQNVDASAKFCPGCGSPVAAALFCKQCGAKLNPGDPFCSKCGSATLPAAQRSRFSFEKLRFDAGSIALLVCAGLLILSMLFFPILSQLGERGLTLFGDTSTSSMDDMQIFMRIIFMLMLAASVACVLFNMTKKDVPCVFAAVVNLGVFLIFNMQATGLYLVAAGDILVLLCVVALFVISFYLFLRQKYPKLFQWRGAKR